MAYNFANRLKTIHGQRTNLQSLDDAAKKLQVKSASPHPGTEQLVLPAFMPLQISSSS